MRPEDEAEQASGAAAADAAASAAAGGDQSAPDGAGGDLRSADMILELRDPRHVRSIWHPPTCTMCSRKRAGFVSLHASPRVISFFLRRF